MTMVLTITSAVLWHLDYGVNPVDEARQEVSRAKIRSKLSARREADSADTKPRGGDVTSDH